MKILSVIDIPWNSALAAYAFDQALALRAGGHQVLFACPAGSAAMDFAGKAGFKAFPIPDRKQYHRLPLALLRLRAVIKSEGVDAVCAHTGLAQTLGGLLSLPLVRVKADAKKPSVGFTFSAVNRTIAASEFIQNLYLKAGLKPELLSVIRQGINIPAVIPHRPRPPYKVGLLGRLDPVKGHACFLNAAALLLKRGVQAEFHIAGYEANLKYSDLKNIAGTLGIEKSVFYHGKVEGPYAFMGACDLGVIPSLGSEAVSRAALEWLASGKPLVASATGSLPEFVDAEWLVPPGEPAALAAKLETLLADGGKLAELGERNRARAERDFSHAAFAAATCAVFEQAAKK